MDGIGKIASQMMGSLGLDSKSIPKDAISNLDPEMMKNVGNIAKTLMGTITNNIESKPKNGQTMIQTVTEALQNPDVANLFDSLSNGNKANQELIDTIPKKNSFKK